MRNFVAQHPWRTATFVLLYGAVLASVFATMSFSAEDVAHQYVARIMNRPPMPLPPLPVVHVLEWPDMTLQRDPFQHLASPTNKATPNQNPSPRTASRRIRGLAASSPDAHRGVVGIKG